MANATEVLLVPWNNYQSVLASSDLTAVRTTDVWDATTFSGAFLVVDYTYSAATDWAAKFETSYDKGTTWIAVPEIQVGGAGDQFAAVFDNATDLAIYVPVNCAGCALMRAKLYSPTDDADAGDLVEAKVVLTRGL